MKGHVLAVLMVGFSVFVSAQESRTYTDEELTKYATVMVWAELEKSRMTGLYNEWINGNEELGAPRFLEIKKTKNDSAALVAIAATPQELNAYGAILADYDSMTSSFKEVYVGRIKEDIGAGLYNALRATLKSDAAVKQRYDAIVEGLKQEGAEGESGQ